MHPLGAIFGAAGLIWLGKKLAYRPAPPTFSGLSSQLSDTVVLPLLESPLPQGSALWCVTLELAWNSSSLSRDDDCELARRLSASTVSAADFPPGCLDFTTPDPLSLGLPPNSRLACCTLNAAQTFAIPFLDSSEALKFHSTAGQVTPVSAFGLRQQDHGKYLQLRKQVEILFRQGDAPGEEEFAVDPCRTSRPFRLVLARIPRPSSLAAGVEYVRSQRENSKVGLGWNDELLIPNQSWEIRQLYCGLEPALDPAGVVYQSIRFRLDRSGCQLFSVSLMAVFGGPGRYFFDRPFLLYMEDRKTGQVLLAQWADNAELLQRY